MYTGEWFTVHIIGIHSLWGLLLNYSAIINEMQVGFFPPVCSLSFLYFPKSHLLTEEASKSSNWSGRITDKSFVWSHLDTAPIIFSAQTTTGHFTRTQQPLDILSTRLFPSPTFRFYWIFSSFKLPSRTIQCITQHLVKQLKKKKRGCSFLPLFSVNKDKQSVFLWVHRVIKLFLEASNDHHVFTPYKIHRRFWSIPLNCSSYGERDTVSLCVLFVALVCQNN